MSYSYEHNPTNADAKPLYNDSIFKFWNWFDDVWSCNDWMVWHNANDKKYGRATANEKFMTEWNNLALASSAIDCRSFNDAFIKYTKAVGLYDAVHGGLLGTITEPIGATTSIVSNVSDTAVGVSKAFKIILPLIMVVLAVMFLVYISKAAKK